MDITFLAICILGITCFHTIQAGCVEDLESNSNFKECKIGYVTFVRGENPSNMAKAVCSDRGRKRMKCMARYLYQCPSLLTFITSGDMGHMEQYFTPAGIDSMCAMMTSVVPVEDDTCAEVKACANRTTIVFGTGDKPGSTPYGRYREYIGTMCGGDKDIFMCFDNAPAECANIVQRVFREMPRRFTDVRKYVTDTCPKLPTGFLTDTCVQTNVESEAFLTCYRQFERELDRTRGNTTCTVFLMGKTCIDQHVGVKCGQASADAISALMPLRVPTPGPTSNISNCQFPPPEASSSVVLTVSLTVLITITTFAGFNFVI